MLKATVTVLSLLLFTVPVSAAVVLNPSPVSAKASSGMASVKKAGGKLPVIDGQEALASVNGDPVTVGEFNRVLIQLHNSLSKAGGNKVADVEKIDYAGVLSRLINISLADHEAKIIGLDKLPQVKAVISQYEDSMLMKSAGPKDMKNVRPDPSVERRVYRRLVKEYELKSAVFSVKTLAQETNRQLLTHKELEQQKRAADLLNSWANNVTPGQDFDEVVSAAIKKGIAVGNLKGYYVKAAEMPASVASVVGKMEVGQTSPLIRGGVDEFVLLKLLGVRYPGGDKAAMEGARQQGLKAARFVRFVSYVNSLQKKYVKVHVNIWRELQKLNYTSSKFDIYKLEKDRRVLADVQGGKPVTVGELAKAVNEKFYHGLRSAKNSEVLDAEGFLLREILAKRALQCQAIAEGVQNSKNFRDAVSDYKRSMLFGLYINTVIVPQVRLEQAELMSYYKKHISDYSSDEMMRIRALVFDRKQDAQNAISMLKKGDEFHWVKANSQGQVPKGEGDVLDFGLSLMDVKTFPPDAKEILKGAKTGDVVLYEDVIKGASKGNEKRRYYALYIEKEVPPAPRPFEDVKSEIRNELFNKKLTEATNAWFAKLRKAYDVKIYDKTLETGKPHTDKKQKN